MRQYVTVGLTVLAGAALLEAALIPGVLIGGAVVLAPRYLPNLRRRLQPLLDSVVSPQTEAAARSPNERAKGHSKATGRSKATGQSKASGLPAIRLPAVLPKFAIGQAIAKTITFRLIVTTLDFTSNYIVIGELGTAAGLSVFALVVGPLFYLVHEAAWNYYAPSAETTIELPSLSSARGFVMSRALAKTITFRTVATAMDFTTMYVVTGSLATAVGLSAFGFVVGPFVYIAHEKAWDYYTSSGEHAPDPAPMKLLPAPV
jgi:uncharacterized membrane protein